MLFSFLAISSYYLLKKQDLPLRRSFAIAAIFGLASTLSVILLGDESGYELGDVQKTKLAAIEAEWDTHPAPAAFTLFGIPNKETQTTNYAVKIPYVMGIIATRSVTEEVTGIKDLIANYEFVFVTVWLLINNLSNYVRATNLLNLKRRSSKLKKT